MTTRDIVVSCPFDHMVVTIPATPATGMVDLVDFCGRGYLCRVRGGCIFAPFRAEDAPDHLF